MMFYFVRQFVERMKVANMVVTYHGAATDIDGVGIVTGDAEYDETKSNFRWQRRVKWIYIDASVMFDNDS